METLTLEESDAIVSESDHKDRLIINVKYETAHRDFLYSMMLGKEIFKLVVRDVIESNAMVESLHGVKGKSYFQIGTLGFVTAL